MKKRRKPEIGKKLMSSVLAMTMAMELAPVAALTANAAVSENLVSSLTNLYDGDETRAREELEALYQAGIIDENGDMVELDICEDGEAVTLEDVSARIAAGEETGDITVNGHAAAPEQLLKIAGTKNALEIAKMLAEDVEITDEHVENLESLIQGIGDGSIDLDAAIESGTLSVNNTTKKAPAVSPVKSVLASDTDTSDFPPTKIKDETFTAMSDYDSNTQQMHYYFQFPFIDGATYNENAIESVSEKEVPYYIDSTTQGISPNAVIKFKSSSIASDGSITVSATLLAAQQPTDTPQSIPVSFDYKAVGDFVGDSQKGTVTWEPGETGTKTFTINVAKGDLLWEGYRNFSINVSNVKGAFLEDEKENLSVYDAFNRRQTTWSTRVGIAAADRERIITNNYVVWKELDNYSPNSNETKVARTIDSLKAKDRVRITVTLSEQSENGVRFARADSTGLELSDSVAHLTQSETNPLEYSIEIGMGNKPDFNTFRLSKLNYNSTNNNELHFSNIKIEKLIPNTHLSISGFSVPAGTYESGNTIPITVKLSNYAKATDSTKLIVNGTECSTLGGVGTEADAIIFGYTVKDTDSGTINITDLTGNLVNGDDEQVIIDGNFPEKTSFGVDDGLTIISNTKWNSFDFDNIKYGIDAGDAWNQVVTVLIPFKENADLTWLLSENEDCTVNGKEMDLPLPGMPNATTGNYLRGAYLSCDNGKTRYPLYIVHNETNETAALAARYVPPKNISKYFRKDTVNIFIDKRIGFDDATEHLDTWANAMKDTKGFAYFDGSDKKDAIPVIGKNYTYYVKGKELLYFEPDAFISRGESDYTDKVQDEWLNLGEDNHVLLNDAEHPENQYDVEIVANDALYKAITGGARAEDGDDLTLSLQFSGRKTFTFTNANDFTWQSSDESIATITVDENGVAHVELTGKQGDVTFTLTVGNGSEDKAYTLAPVSMTVLEGKTPFLNIPKYSQIRQTLTGIDTDVAFSSNVTARNAQLGKDTVFTVNVYKAAPVTGTEDVYNRTGEPIWTGSFTSTAAETLTHVTIPGSQLTSKGAYAVEISAEYVGGKIGETETAQQTLSATAILVAKQAPASVSLNQLDSYYVTADKIPEIGYTVSAGATEVEYTIQKSGEDVGERIAASNGRIPFSPTAPTSLKEAYTITVYARNSAEGDWSVDSMLLTVYNPDILDQIVADVTAGKIGGTTGGTGEGVRNTTVAMDNHGKMANYGVDEDGEYQLTFDDFTALRTDMSLQKIVSVNYGDGVWGMLSDKMMWESSDPKKVSVDYKQGGIYSDVRNYSYTSYAPATDFLIVGKDETGEGEKVTITATHANTGIQSSFDVTTTMLKDQLYVFRFVPAVKTDVIYTNGKGEKRTLSTNDNGELAVYEPDGIYEPVMARSEYDGKTWVGTLYPDDLISGERDVASLQLYPCNNLRMRVISDATLTFLDPDGNPYTGDVIIRGGAYKNGIYCPGALLSVDNNQTKHNGREDITAHVENGKLNITLDPTQFKHDPDSTEEYGGAQPGDNITYVFEYRFADTEHPEYQPGYVILNAYTDLYGASSPTDSVVYMRNNTSGNTMPQIIHQNLQQYYDGEATSYTRNVIDFTSNIGVSKRFAKATLTTDIALPGETVSHDDNGYTTYSSKDVPGFTLYDPNNQEFTGQVDNTKTTADQIIDLNDLESSTLFVFPFSEVPVARNCYTMTDENLKQDGLTDEGTDPNTTSSMKAAFTQSGMTIKTETMPFGVSNLSHQLDLSTNDGGAKEVGDEVDKELKSKLDMGSIFGDIDVNDMLKQGFVFMSKLSAVAGETPMNMMILPTEDPGTFRIVVSIGYNKREMETDTNPSIDFDPDHLYDDMESFQKELEELGKDDDDDDDDGDSGEGSVHINFYGTVILEAKVGVLGNKWGVDFIGGSVGTNFEAKYEWSQNTMVGPVPVTISLEIKGNADLEVSFANKAEARALLIDAVVGVSVEAFAGLGFDLSIVALKIGIFGRIGAEDNFLYLTTGNQTGNQLEISGEIGVKFVAKIALVKYEKTLASTGFNWKKKWGNYDQIKQQWAEEGYAELSGSTIQGKPFTMQLMSNGTALVNIDGGNEIENRDYLKRAPMLRNAPKPFGAASDGMALLQENAYPYSNPVLTDDGSIMLFISDNNNSDEPQSVVSYAVKNGDSYDIKGAVDTSEGNILADTDVVASGTDNHAFAAWVKQMDSPDKEMHDSTTYDDLGMMLNATEIYTSTYNGTEWTVQRLTENTNADMAPTVASSGNHAIVAWRSLTASSMPEEGSAQDITAMFNVENTINYRIFNGTEWVEAKIAYNGSAGTVNAIDSAMLPDGTSLLVYSVRTTDDITGSETFYTLINSEGEVVTTGRLTNDSYTDTNAQVAAVGDQFIVGWYSEHEAGEKGNTNETVVSHDIGLARINANGSVDASFPESIGGTAAAKIGSDFHFSAPAGCERLSDLSIVWSQQKESDKAEDEGKYQLNAVRFFESNGVIGVTAQTTIAETGKHYTIDSFDTYTDTDGTVKAVLLGSDYSANGVNVYDTIDLTDLPIQSVNDAGESSDMLAILEKEPTASMKLASGTFAESEIEVTADTNLRELMPGLDLPVQFTIRNTGTGKVNSVQAQIGGQAVTTFNNLNLLPGQSTVVTVNYAVPETNIQDAAYTLTADGSGKATGTLVLDRPDVGISGMKIVREGGKTRDVRITLSNATNIPLVGSGKTVKLAFYKDMDRTERIGSEIILDSTAYQDIDEGIFTYIQTVNVSDFIGDAQEVPEGGVRIYASAWVEDTDELYMMNNEASTTFGGLLAKYKSQTTMDTALVADDGDDYTVSADITNNSLQDANLGSITADILDSDGAVLTSIVLTEGDLMLTGEQNVKLTKALPEITGEPASVSLRSSEKSVTLDAQTNGGSVDVLTIDLTTDNKPSGVLPEATKEGHYLFDGWFTEPEGGEQITEDTVLEGGSTVYAQFKYVAPTPTYYSQSWTLTMNSYEYDGTAHTPTINGRAYTYSNTEVKYTYYNADTDEKLDGAPSAIGNYKVKVYADGGSNYLGRTQYATYSITDPIDKNGMANVDAFKENDTVPVSDGKIFAGWFTDETCTTAYTEDTGKAYAKFIDENILTVKAQISSGTTANSEKTSIRFITSVDSLKYQNVGFKITFNGKTIDKQMTKVYTAFNAGGKKISPKVFSEDSNYMEAYTLNNIPQSAFGKEFTVTPYYTTQDGTIVEGATNTFTIANMIK